MSDTPVANTADHEKLISEGAKTMVGGIMDMAIYQINQVIERVQQATESNDPLSLERWIHNADRLVDMADKLWDLGEKAFQKSHQLYERGAKK
jgi:uncharacterized protein (DUF2344 family)